MNIEVILFDLGGVLIELTGVPDMMCWSGLDESEVWKRWLASPAVRDFESGRSTPEYFATALVAEFEMDTSPEEFMDAFIRWPSGPYEGAIELLERLGERYHLACLSNTNQLHWHRFERETPLLANLHSHFASHRIGKLKPDMEIYRHAIAELGKPPDRILFLDDNQINVDAALRAGMHAVRARGIGDVKGHLQRLGVGQL